MSITCEQYDRVTVVNITNELASEQVELFRRQFAEQLDAGGRFFVLNLQNTTLFDSAALEALLWAQEKCQQQLGHLQLCGLDENLRRILHVTRLESHFDLLENVTEAVKAMR